MKQFLLIALLSLSTIAAHAEFSAADMDPAEAANFIAKCPTQAAKLVAEGKWIGQVMRSAQTKSDSVRTVSYLFQSYKRVAGYITSEDSKLIVQSTITAPPANSADMESTVTYQCKLVPAK